MAKCDEGYRCDVCGEDVTGIVDSDLYLRFVIGEADPEQLHVAAERHLRCNPVLSQFIDDDRFQAPRVDGPLGKDALDAEFVRQRTEYVTRGYRRLHEINGWEGDRDVTEYPLPEAIEKYRNGDDAP
ncbi:MAG: hypothetical protein AAF958_08945 [Planctomycetota bacterium]